jgi:hypothetical protein
VDLVLSVWRFGRWVRGGRTHVASADTDVGYADYYVVGIGEGGVGTFFNLCDARTVEVAGGVLGESVHCGEDDPGD